MAHMAQKTFGSNTKKKPNCTTRKSTKPRQRARTWILTLNNPSSELLAQLRSQKALLKYKVKQYLIQEEVGKEGTPHLQGAIQFEDNLEFNTVKRIFPTAHWEKSRSLARSFTYCGKLKTRAGEVFTYGPVEKYIEREPITYDEFRRKLLKDICNTVPKKVIFEWDDMLGVMHPDWDSLEIGESSDL